MEKRRRLFQRLKSIAGVALMAPILFTLRAIVSGTITQVSQLRGSVSGDGLFGLRLVLLAASFDHHRVVPELIQTCGLFCLLLPGTVGAGLLWSAFRDSDRWLS